MQAAGVAVAPASPSWGPHQLHEAHAAARAHAGGPAAGVVTPRRMLFATPATQQAQGDAAIHTTPTRALAAHTSPRPASPWTGTGGQGYGARNGNGVADMGKRGGYTPARTPPRAQTHREYTPQSTPQPQRGLGVGASPTAATKSPPPAPALAFDALPTKPQPAVLRGGVYDPPKPAASTPTASPATAVVFNSPTPTALAAQAVNLNRAVRGCSLALSRAKDTQLGRGGSVSVEPVDAAAAAAPTDPPASTAIRTPQPVPVPALPPPSDTASEATVMPATAVAPSSSTSRVVDVPKMSASAASIAQPQPQSFSPSVGPPPSAATTSRTTNRPRSATTLHAPQASVAQLLARATPAAPRGAHNGTSPLLLAASTARTASAATASAHANGNKSSRARAASTAVQSNGVVSSGAGAVLSVIPDVPVVRSREGSISLSSRPSTSSGGRAGVRAARATPIDKQRTPPPTFTLSVPTPRGDRPLVPKAATPPAVYAASPPLQRLRTPSPCDSPSSASDSSGVSLQRVEQVVRAQRRRARARTTPVDTVAGLLSRVNVLRSQPPTYNITVVFSDNTHVRLRDIANVRELVDALRRETGQAVQATQLQYKGFALTLRTSLHGFKREAGFLNEMTFYLEGVEATGGGAAAVGGDPGGDLQDTEAAVTVPLEYQQQQQQQQQALVDDGGIGGVGAAQPALCSPPVTAKHYLAHPSWHDTPLGPACAGTTPPRPLPFPPREAMQQPQWTPLPAPLAGPPQPTSVEQIVITPPADTAGRSTWPASAQDDDGTGSATGGGDLAQLSRLLQDEQDEYAAAAAADAAAAPPSPTGRQKQPLYPLTLDTAAPASAQHALMKMRMQTAGSSDLDAPTPVARAAAVSAGEVGGDAGGGVSQQQRRASVATTNSDARRPGTGVRPVGVRRLNTIELRVAVDNLTSAGSRSEGGASTLDDAGAVAAQDAGAQAPTQASPPAGLPVFNPSAHRSAPARSAHGHSGPAGGGGGRSPTWSERPLPNLSIAAGSEPFSEPLTIPMSVRDRRLSPGPGAAGGGGGGAEPVDRSRRQSTAAGGELLTAAKLATLLQHDADVQGGDAERQNTVSASDASRHASRQPSTNGEPRFGKFDKGFSFPFVQSEKSISTKTLATSRTASAAKRPTESRDESASPDGATGTPTGSAGAALSFTPVVTADKLGETPVRSNQSLLGAQHVSSGTGSGTLRGSSGGSVAPDAAAASGGSGSNGAKTPRTSPGPPLPESAAAANARYLAPSGSSRPPSSQNMIFSQRSGASTDSREPVPALSGDPASAAPSAGGADEVDSTASDDVSHNIVVSRTPVVPILSKNPTGTKNRSQRSVSIFTDKDAPVVRPGEAAKAEPQPQPDTTRGPSPSPRRGSFDSPTSDGSASRTPDSPRGDEQSSSITYSKRPEHTGLVQAWERGGKAVRRDWPRDLVAVVQPEGQDPICCCANRGGSNLKLYQICKGHQTKELPSVSFPAGVETLAVDSRYVVLGGPGCLWCWDVVGESWQWQVQNTDMWEVTAAGRGVLVCGNKEGPLELYNIEEDPMSQEGVVLEDSDSPTSPWERVSVDPPFVVGVVESKSCLYVWSIDRPPEGKMIGYRALPFRTDRGSHGLALEAILCCGIIGTRDEKAIFLWRARDGTLFKSWSNPGNAVMTLDGTRTDGIIVVVDAFYLRLFELETYDALGEWQTPPGVGPAVQLVSAGTKCIISVHKNGIVEWAPHKRGCEIM